MLGFFMAIIPIIGALCGLYFMKNDPCDGDLAGPGWDSEKEK